MAHRIDDSGASRPTVNIGTESTRGKKAEPSRKQRQRGLENTARCAYKDGNDSPSNTSCSPLARRWRFYQEKQRLEKKVKRNLMLQ